MNYETKYINIAKDLILKHIPKEDFAVFLFGSRASGKANRRSDIDVGVLGNKEFPRLIKIKIEEELEESIIPYKVDIIDFFDVSDTFKNIALQKIIKWNIPKNISVS